MAKKRHPQPASKETAASTAPSEWVTFRRLSDSSKRALGYLKQIVKATSMADHVAAVQHLSEHVDWDAPPVLVHDRETMRVIVYLAKTVAYLDFEGYAFKEEEMEGNRRKLEMLCDFSVFPHRAWWFPAGYLLPAAITLKATLKLGLEPEAGTTKHKIAWIWGRIHNLPALPNVIRYWNVFWMGTVGRWTEPLWSQLLQLVSGDRSLTHPVPVVLHMT